MLRIYHQADSVAMAKRFRTFSKLNLSRIRQCKSRHFEISRNNTLTLVVSQGCNLGCVSCFRTRVAHDCMREDLLQRMVEYASKHLFSVSITGGEPTEYIDLIIAAVMPYPNMRVNITTHGETLDESMVVKLKECPNIFPILSLNGLEETHNASRHPRSFARLINGIAKLREHQVPFGFITVVNQTNIAQLLSGRLAEFIDYVAASTWEIFQYYAIGENAQRYSELQLTGEATEQAISYRNKLLSENSYHFSYASAQINSKRCKRQLQILLDGSVSYCPFSVWAFDTVSASDSDETIREKLEQFTDKWEELTRRSTSFCPLQCNTQGYVEFFSENGREMWPPTGILDRATTIPSTCL